MAGKLIVIEGIDASGKKTQSFLLKDNLEKRGLKVKLRPFPQYGTPFGQLVAKYLKGELGSKENLPVEIPSILYALDRYQFKVQMTADLEEGTWIICDRYFQSNYGFQGAKVKGKERSALLKWLKNLDSRMPQPDVVIFLNIPAKKAAELLNGRANHDETRAPDIHEIDIKYQKEVVKTYLRVAKKENWIIIDCMDGERLRTPEEIHNEVLEVVKRLF